MKISILTPNLSGNAIGRAWVLGKLLCNEFEVEIIGPSGSGRIWEPLEEEKGINFVPVKAYSKTSDFKKQSLALQEAISGDVIYVSKPLLSIIQPALTEKRINKKKFFLDIDDWQMGFQYKKLPSPVGLYRILWTELICACGSDSFWNALIGEFYIKHADAISVSNKYLQTKYGGIIIPHARDGTFLNPENFSSELIKSEFGISPNVQVVSFIGSPRPHKGLEDLIKAVKRITDPNLVLMVVGFSTDEYSKALRKSATEQLGERFAGFGIQKFEDLPRFLAMADVVVIPQKKTLATAGQTPAKVFDAMAMGKPIVANDVGDLPEILEGCGYIVSPGDVNALAGKIEYILANTKEAAITAQRARQRFLDNYDIKVVREKAVRMIYEHCSKEN